ncbi:Endonuclease V [Morus notabilis]|uniref:Endonuclease V n=1 Tax=Morus notabilis TaxID=981085 RepID=W9QZ36_9ROSA|nr:Endonuclease V [Morus notabilis]
MANSNLDTDNESQCGTEPAPPPSNWEESQDSMKKKLIAEDEFVSTEALRYVGGVDISFSKEDPSVACGTLVVLELHSLRVVYEDFSVVTLHVPYVPGFLAFREAPVLLELLEKMKNNANPFYPQLHHVDGLTLSRVKELLKAREHLAEDFITLTGDSGRIWGVAMRSTGGSLKPIFVSIGHRMSLDTAVAIVKMTCKYRVPEPIRQADIRSREYLRKHRV